MIYDLSLLCSICREMNINFEIHYQHTQLLFWGKNSYAIFFFPKNLHENKCFVNLMFKIEIHGPALRFLVQSRLII